MKVGWHVFRGEYSAARMVVKEQVEVIRASDPVEAGRRRKRTVSAPLSVVKRRKLCTEGPTAEGSASSDKLGSSQTLYKRERGAKSQTPGLDMVHVKKEWSVEPLKVAPM